MRSRLHPKSWRGGEFLWQLKILVQPAQNEGLAIPRRCRPKPVARFRWQLPQPVVAGVHHLYRDGQEHLLAVEDWARMTSLPELAII